MTYSMPAPLANRFSHYDFDVNLDDWVAWAHRHDVDERLIAFLRFRPERLFDFDPALEPVAFPSPRSWEFAHHALQKFESRNDILIGALQACVGDAAGVELGAFVENLLNLPDIDAIVRGEAVAMPESIDLQYAVASALVGHARRASQSDGDEQGQRVVANILEFAKQFPQREMGVMLVSDLHRAVGDMVFASTSFADWANDVADVMLYRG